MGVGRVRASFFDEAAIIGAVEDHLVAVVAISGPGSDFSFQNGPVSSPKGHFPLPLFLCLRSGCGGLRCGSVSPSLS